MSDKEMRRKSYIESQTDSQRNSRISSHTERCINRIMLAGTGSGCGKTTVTCALLKAFVLKGIKATGFKCGPDYIDPMFHSEIIGTKSRNLDLFLCGENTVKYLLSENGKGADISVIEGVMGLYDGLGFTDDGFSANHIARATKTPEILVMGVRGKSLSLLAELSGYLNYAENNIKGVILNQCSSGMYPVYRKMIEEAFPDVKVYGYLPRIPGYLNYAENNIKGVILNQCSSGMYPVYRKMIEEAFPDVKVYGYLPRIPEAELGSRHLGLVTADEVADLKEKTEALGAAAVNSLDIEGILKLSQSAPALEFEEISVESVVFGKEKPRIAVAKDKAFCFYYEDNFRLLEKLGAEIVFFSPLKDEKLPEHISGLYLGGGYPEEHLKELSENRMMLREIKGAVLDGLPTFAECGGFMYLCQSIEKDGFVYETAGALPGSSHMTQGLVRFGYKTLTANRENLMCGKGDSIRCHEFHYSDSNCYGDGFTAEKGKRTWQTIQASETYFAGYPHLHLWGNIAFAENFVKACCAYGGKPWK